MKNKKRLFRFIKKNKKKYKLLDDNEPFYTNAIYNKKKLLKSKSFIKYKNPNLNLHFITKIFLTAILLILFLSFKKNKKRNKIENKNVYKIENKNVYKIENINGNKNENKKNYYACFSGMGKKENRYLRELIEYYLKLGVGKFILGDNNLPNTEKFADVIQDYINDGTVDVIELFGSSFGQGALNNVTYEKYNKQCKWMLFLDFDEFLEVHFEDKKSLLLKDFLENKIFDKCEAILFNVLVHTDNNLVHYDNRPLNVRFTEPNYELEANRLVKAIVRGNLSKIIYLDGRPNNSPDRGVEICDSKGRKIERYDPYFLDPPVYDYGYLKHYTTKTAEEYITKILRGQPGNIPHDVNYRIELFFKFNKYSDEKMKIFEDYFHRKFNHINN